MGNFNPNQPFILGMEYVPIQSSVRVLDIGTEWGYGFTVTGAPFNALNVVQPMPFRPASSIAGQTLLYNVYPRGREDDVGDVQVVRWPVATAFVTGATVSGSSAATALADGFDNNCIIFNASTNKLRVTFSAPFALTGQRILGVNLIYQAAGTPGFVLEPTIESNTVIYPYGPYMTGPASLAQIAEEGQIRLGEVNPWWSTAAGPDTEPARMPWRYTDMLRWQVGTGGQLYFGVRVNTLPLSGFARLGYLAMDVYYCEESRVAYGGRAYGQDPAGLLSFDTLLGASPTMRDPSFNNPVTLTAGDYTTTVTLADAGDKYNAGDKYAIPQIYQYAGVSTHPAIMVEKFKPSVGVGPGLVPKSSSTNYMVASSLNASPGGSLQNGEASVPYISIEGAPVYITPAGASISVDQEIWNGTNGLPTTSAPLCRFYARRFNPAGPGNLQISAPGTGAVSISAAEFAALPELTTGENGPGTGWREVNISVPGAVWGTGGAPAFQTVGFTMSGVSSGQAIDMYQIMTARVFTYSTTQGRAPYRTTSQPLYEKSRYDGQQNAIMTWKTPENLTTTETADTTSTAIVMFSQELAAPTGTGAAVTSMPVSGIGRDCGVPMCIPTSIYANLLTWSPIAVTGAFNYYEIQRSDSMTDWQAIAYVTGHHTTSFTDWEARAAVQSDYRMRSVNVSRFAGPWSSTFSSTLTSPGAGGVGTGNSLLMFTSNFGPTGNLAYIMQWEGEPVQDFVFPEAGFVSLQTQYQRDYFTAHHPTERGGVQFSRTMLVQAASIPVGSLAGFTGLRNMGWAARPYVCVRDQRGNRWFAIVQVPAGNVHSNNTAYLAEITVTQSTATAAPVTVP